MTYGALSKYRGFLMGFAILWVMYFHIPLKFATEVGWFIHRIGFYGVDIFLFLSGLGVYYSLTKRPNVLGFYKARLVRILPAYIIVACASYCLLRLDRASALDFFYYISGIGYWTRHARFDWYIPTQLAFYLITPLFLFFYKKLGGKKQIIYTSACMSLSVPLCVIMYYNDLIYLWGTAVRLSVFLLGIHTGTRAEQDKKGTKTTDTQYCGIYSRNFSRLLSQRLRQRAGIYKKRAQLLSSSADDAVILPACLSRTFGTQ